MSSLNVRRKVSPIIIPIKHFLGTQFLLGMVGMILLIQSSTQKFNFFLFPHPTTTTRTKEIPTTTSVPFSSNVLIYITTIFSAEHRRYLHCCWPQLLNQSRLFRHTHINIFSNNETELDESYLADLQEMFLSYGVKSFGYKFADHTPELDLLEQIPHPGMKKQWGANMAMSIALSQGWFQPYDWVIRINPDVLIRKSDLIIDHVDDSSIDGIFAVCETEDFGRRSRANTDFFAFRPKILPRNAFSKMENADLGNHLWNHELTATKNFLPIIESKRFVTVPNLHHSTHCRVRGKDAPVYHQHDS